MVWKNAREELYSAVARNNSSVLSPQNAAVVVKREQPPQQRSGGNAPQSAPQHEQRESVRQSAPQCEQRESVRQSAPQCEQRVNAPRNTQPADPIRALLSDRDALILIALILLLLHEKADIKLIGALAFVLLA